MIEFFVLNFEYRTKNILQNSYSMKLISGNENKGLESEFQ